MITHVGFTTHIAQGKRRAHKTTIVLDAIMKTRRLLFIGLVGLFFWAYSASSDVELMFNLRTNGPLEPVNPYVYLQLTLVDPEGEATKLAHQFENGPKGLDGDERLAVCKWYLSKFRFVEAEKIAEGLIKEDRDDPSFGLTLAVAKVCRGDYEAAKSALQKPIETGNKFAKALLLYLQVVLTDDLKKAEPLVREVVKSAEFNELPAAQAAVLAFCLKWPNGDKTLFEGIIKRIDRDSLVRDEIAAKMYITLCKRYGKLEEAEKIEKMLKNAKRSETAVG